MEPVEPVLKNIYQNNTYRKDLSWPHFDNEPRVQEKQQVKDQRSCISVFGACLTNPSMSFWKLANQPLLYEPKVAGFCDITEAVMKIYHFTVCSESIKIDRTKDFDI